MILKKACKIPKKHEIYYWGLSLADMSAPEFKTLSQYCNQPEQERAQKFIFEKDRRSYLAAHGLLRLALSHCEVEYHPGEWEFETSKYGKPYLSGKNQQKLNFNLSHCASRVVCLVTYGLECGIDVEPVRRINNIDRLARNCLSEQELNWLNSKPLVEKEANFMQFWTLKEAVSKALGLGLNIPFDELVFDMENTPDLLHTPTNIDNHFWLHQFNPDAEHVEALALRANPAEVDIILRNMQYQLSL